MAKATKCNKKILVHSSATSLRCNQSNAEEVQINVDEEEKDMNQSAMSKARRVTDNSLNKEAEVSQLFESNTELQEEYKQLLVKAVAERIRRKMSEEDIWKEIQKETEYNHKIVWNAMRETTLQKIMSLLPANDLLENIPTEMKMTPTDWLLFDLILVHEEIDVLNIDSLARSAPTTDTQLHVPTISNSNNEEPECLQHLFELVKQYDVENLVGDALINAWTQITLEYNSRGRQCSPMILQLRWYQLKKQTRCCFYNSYLQQRNNQVVQDTLQPSLPVIVLTVLQIAIAVAYNKVISQEYPTWQSLIDEKRVILSEEFTGNILHYENKTDINQAPGPTNAPPVLLIKLDGNQLPQDLDKEKNKNHDTIVIDLKDDVEYANVLQKLINESAEPTTQVVTNVFEENDELFKQRLIKEMAKMVTLQNKPVKYMWQKLKTRLGRDCKEMWGRMRNATIKKLTNLLATDDVPQQASTTMRLSDIDWLLFDLVLVYENVYIINFDQLEAKCLRDLFELVKVHHVENLEEEELVAAWINLTLEYNRGGRQCSPMLLQLRWHRLKELSRLQVYKPSMLLNRSKSKMLIEIATKYQKIITQKWTPWKEYVRTKSVVLPESFIMTLKRKNRWRGVEARDGWYLHIKEEISNLDNDTIIGNKEVITISDDVTHVISNPPECNSKDKLDTIVESSLKNPSQSTIPKSRQIKEPQIIELDSDDEINEILREKVDRLNTSQEKVKISISNLQLKSDDIDKNVNVERLKNCEDADEIVNKQILKASINNTESILCDSDEEIDKLLQEKANLMSIRFPKNLNSLAKIIGNEVDEFKKANNSRLCGMEVEEVGIISKDMIKTDNQYDEFDEVDFDKNNIELVDDGIKFEEGFNSTMETVEPSTDFFSEFDNENNVEESDDDLEIDLKLLMNTSVYTKKIDRMEVFKFMDYESVNDKRIIEYVELESKPVNKRTLKDADIESFREQAIPRYDKHNINHKGIEETFFQNANNRVKYTSWLLQKPKKRKYKSRQLSKNPDFNTQLKRLTTTFLSSTRNKLLLKECQPLTIDLHKAFEKKLISGTMYLKRGVFTSNKVTGIKSNNGDEFAIAPPSLPSMFTDDQKTKLAEHVRDLIATMTDDNQEEENLEVFKDIPKYNQEEENLEVFKDIPKYNQEEENLEVCKDIPKLPISRNKVINLPDKDQIRLINQSLLTAEIIPRHQPLLNLPTVNGNEKDISEPTTIFLSSGESPSKRLKTDLNIPESRLSKSSPYCCWAREKIIIIEQNIDLDCSKHKCINCCTCCCRIDLVTLLNFKRLDYQITNDPSLKMSKLSDDLRTNSPRNHSKIYNPFKARSSGLNKIASTLKPPEILNTNNIQNNRKVKLNSNPMKSKVINGVISDVNKVVINRNLKRIEGPSSRPIQNTVTLSKVLNYTLHSDNAYVKRKVFNKPKVLQPLAKARTINEKRVFANRVPQFKPIAPRLPTEGFKSTESATCLILPAGVNFIKLDDKKLAVAINPGVQLKSEQLQSLMAVCASVNNTIPEEHSTTLLKISSL